MGGEPGCPIGRARRIQRPLWGEISGALGKHILPVTLSVEGEHGVGAEMGGGLTAQPKRADIVFFASDGVGGAEVLAWPPST